LSRKALCEVLHRFGQRGIEYRVLPTHQFIDALGQRGPLRRRQIEVAAQVQQRGLLDDVAHAGTMHQAVGDVGLTRDAAAGLGATNEHARDVARKRGAATNPLKLLWHYILLSNRKSMLARTCGQQGREFRGKLTNLG